MLSTLYFPRRNEVEAYLNPQEVFDKAYRKGLRRRKPQAASLHQRPQLRPATPGCFAGSAWRQNYLRAAAPTKMMSRRATPQWPAHHFMPKSASPLSAITTPVIDRSDAQRAEGRDLLWQCRGRE